MEHKCPYCGGQLSTESIESDMAEVTSPTARAVFRTMAPRAGKWFTTDELADAVWAADPNGGPDHWRTCIAHAIRINKGRLHDWRIESRRGPGGGYRIVHQERCA